MVKENFEFRSISKSVLATNWRKATGYEQDRFVDYFTQTLENTYLTAIESYNGEEVKYDNKVLAELIQKHYPEEFNRFEIYYGWKK